MIGLLEAPGVQAGEFYFWNTLYALFFFLLLLLLSSSSSVGGCRGMAGSGGSAYIPRVMSTTCSPWRSGSCGARAALCFCCCIKLLLVFKCLVVAALTGEGGEEEDGKNKRKR